MAFALPSLRIGFKPFAALTILAALPTQSAAQSTQDHINCETATVNRTVRTGGETGPIDWLEFIDQSQTISEEIRSSEGCLIDTQHVNFNESAEALERKAEIDKLLESQEAFHRQGPNMKSDRGRKSRLISEEIEKDTASLTHQMNNLPTPILLLIIFGAIALFAVVLRALIPRIRSSLNGGVSRFTCKIPAELMVNGQYISGRIVRLGPSIGYFVPNSDANANFIAGLVMRPEPPDFDLKFETMTLPVVPETPGSPFTSLYFVETLEKQQLEALKPLSSTPVRIEKKAPINKKSTHRENLRQLRLQKMQEA